MKYSRPSLKLILGGVFGLLVFILVALLSLAVDLIATRQLREDTHTLLITLAQQMTDRVDRDLFERYREIMLAAETRTLLRDPQASIDERRALLETLQQSFADYAWLGLTDANGTALVATNGMLEGEDFAPQAWFQQGRFAPYIGVVSGTGAADEDQLSPYVVVAAPVYSSTGELSGVLGAYLDWQWVSDGSLSLVRAVTSEHQVEVLLVSQDGDVLFGPSAWNDRRLDLPSMVAGIEQAYTAVERWPDGKQYVTSYAPAQGYRELPPLGWLVLVRQPVEQAYATVRHIQWLIIATGALCALLFTFVVWILADRLTRQLQAIASAADRIRQGETNVIPLLTGSEEVATLSGSLNRLVEELMTATTAERNRIARDLHDSVTQTLFSASMLADVLPRLWEADPKRGKAKLEELRRAVRGALAEMRTLLLELRPAALIDTEMERLLRQLADATSGRSGVTVNWQVEGACDLPPDVKVALYRIVQESLGNVVKHASASQVAILLRCDEQRVELTIRDDGRGFDLAGVTGDHFGLDMMRERLHAIGAGLQIQSQPEQGTVIQAVWPNGQN